MARSHVLCVALVLASCGGSSGTGKPGEPSSSSCKPEDRGSDRPGDVEAALTTSLREHAGLEAILDDRTQELLDQADALRAEAAGEAAAMAGLPEPADAPIDGFCSSELGLTSQAWAYRALGMSLAVSSLPSLIERIPFSGSTGGSAQRSSQGGDPRITTSVNAYFEGDGKSLVAAEMRGVVDIASSTQGSLHEDTIARASIDACPDADGKVDGKVHFQFSGIATPVGGDPWTYGTTMDSDFRFEVDDDAEIATVVIDSSLSYRTTGAAAVDLVATGSASFDGGLDRVTAADLHWDRQDGSLDAVSTVQREILSAAVMAAVVTRDKAREAWRGGKCVEVKTDREGGQVPSGRPTTFVATAHHKLENQDIDAKIQGHLEGARSLSPNTQRVPSPATYEYTPGDDGRGGTVHLETVSKRGIGKKDLTFTGAAVRWKGTVTIRAHADKNESVPYSSDKVQGTRTEYHREDYAADLTVEGTDLGLLTLGGTMRATRAFGWAIDETGTGGGGCRYQMTESMDVDLSGSASPSEGSGSIVAGGGQFFLVVIPPTIDLVGMDSHERHIEPLTQNCDAAPDIDDSAARNESASHSLQLQGAFDASMPVIAGTKEDPPDPDTGLVVTYEWNLRLE